MRHDGRQSDQLRPIEIARGFTKAVPGSVLIRAGDTHVLCTASIVEGVPTWREASGKGWLTAEYDMLPGSVQGRRERRRDGIDGRAQEIQRLIGRSLRMAVDMTRMGQRTIYLDCDVLQADGGTRTAAITGAYVALRDALAEGMRLEYWRDDVATAAVAAVSVGVVDGEVLLDLNYGEDVAAEVDCNLVMTDRDEWIEVQATGERSRFGDDQLARMLALGRAGIHQLFQAQKVALAEPSER
ncbi:MAG: ribonuclease PH [Phycisphaerae bacterium]|nr:ribonuclease PH [Phycisphaerae bacterium]